MWQNEESKLSPDVWCLSVHTLLHILMIQNMSGRKNVK